MLGFLSLPLCWVFFVFRFHRGSFRWVGLLLCLVSASQGWAEVVSAMLNLRNCIIDVSGVCNFLDSVLSQQKFEVTNVKALGASQLSVLQLHVTAQFYLENKGKYILEVWGHADPKDVKRERTRERDCACAHGRASLPRPLQLFGSSFYMFFPPPWACPM